MCRNNHKYTAPHFGTVENLSNDVHKPAHFPNFAVNDPLQRTTGPSRSPVVQTRTSSLDGETQSERDWAYAMRALARGDQSDAVAREIAAYRPDKPNPQYYAEHTVEKAPASLNRSSQVRYEANSTGPER